MRRLSTLLLLIVPFACGCGTAAQDVAAAKQFVKGFYSNPGIVFQVDKTEGPEYAKIERIPRDQIAKGYPDRSAACAVRVWFTWRDGGRTTHDSWIVWVSKDHKGVGYSNPKTEPLRQYVKSVAKNPAPPTSLTPTPVAYQPAAAPAGAANETEPANSTAKSRLWTKADKSSMIRATFLSLSGNIVKLRKWDGMEIRLPLDQLCQADRDWIEENQEKN